MPFEAVERLEEALSPKRSREFDESATKKWEEAIGQAFTRSIRQTKTPEFSAVLEWRLDSLLAVAADEIHTLFGEAFSERITIRRSVSESAERHLVQRGQ